MNKISNISAALFVMVSLLITVCHADSRGHSRNHSTNLIGLTLEELMNIEITSVSKKPEKLFDAASAVFVITEEDIRRSGVTTIPEALRMAPGVQVAHIDSNKWAITTRGLNSRFANKLLVLIDGRTVYTPLFSGVYWDVQDTLLEDIDRIEVIRGSGATLWGSNAVNGVINIITKQTKDTQGGLLTAGFGDEERGFGSVRYGSKLGDDFYFRVYAKFFNRDDAVFASGEGANDNWNAIRGGFRADWEVGNHDFLTIQGDIYDGVSAQTLNLPSQTRPFVQSVENDMDVAGGNIIVRWKHTLSNDSNMSLQLYFDRTERKQVKFRNDLDIYDAEFKYKFKLGERHDIVCGLNYRFIEDDTRDSFTLSLDPESHGRHLFSTYVQDEIMLAKDRLSLTIGSKFEHNDFTGLEIQPSARMLWKPHENHSVWASFSRAVRTPSRNDNDARVNQSVSPLSPIPNSPTIFVSAFGDNDFKSEILYSYELGYRVILFDKLSMDVAIYYNNYDRLRTLEPGGIFSEPFPGPPHFVAPFRLDNEMDGETYGVELAAEWQPVDWWGLKVSYTYLQVQMHLDKGSGDTVSEAFEEESPHNQVYARSSFDLPKDIALDLIPRYTDSLPSLDVSSYVTLDARLSWKPLQNMELSVVGQNLFDNHRPEFRQRLFINSDPTDVERSVYGKIEWRF